MNNIAIENINTEAIEKWLEALRSGKYKQSKYFLKSKPLNKPKDSYSYCCLGVLCEITKDALDLEISKKEDLEILCVRYNVMDTQPPEEVMKFIGITDNTFLHDLISLNDDYDCNFMQIAKFIEIYVRDRKRLTEEIKQELYDKLNANINRVFSK